MALIGGAHPYIKTVANESEKTGLSYLLPVSRETLISRGEAEILGIRNAGVVVPVSVFQQVARYDRDTS